MHDDSLQTFIGRAQSAFDGDPRETSARVHGALEALVRAPEEPWLRALHAALPAREELHRDPLHGFLLLAHSETPGLYRQPHDHGRSWVVYALQHGEMEVSTYRRVEDERGVRLVKRDVSHLYPGDVRVYRQGDIHDTRCLVGPSLYFRFTQLDLAVEEREGRLARYVARDGVWTAGSP